MSTNKIAIDLVLLFNNLKVRDSSLTPRLQFQDERCKLPIYGAIYRSC